MWLQRLSDVACVSTENLSFFQVNYNVGIVLKTSCLLHAIVGKIKSKIRTCSKFQRKNKTNIKIRTNFATGILVKKISCNFNTIIIIIIIIYTITSFFVFFFLVCVGRLLTFISTDSSNGPRSFSTIIVFGTMSFVLINGSCRVLIWLNYYYTRWIFFGNNNFCIPLWPPRSAYIG